MKTTTESLTFLETIFINKPSDLWLYLWKDRKSKWFQSIEDAAEFGVGKQNYYFGCCLSAEDNGESARCTASNAAASPGFWCDIDYADGTAAHKAKNLPFPPDEESAHKIIDSVGVKPTLIVHSGHGLQAYWLFESLMIFSDDSQRKDFARRSQAFQERLIGIGARLGWHVDSVGDLARILRLPGTINAKKDCPVVQCRLIVSDGPRIVSADHMVDGGLLDYRSNGHGPVGIDENPEAGTVIGRPAEHWERIAAGVGEGSRDNDMTSFAGKLLGRMASVDNLEAVEWEFAHVFVPQNKLNKPPLSLQELKKIWSSVLKAEKRRRGVQDHAGNLKLFNAPEKGASTSWKVREVNSSPPVFLLSGPKWVGEVKLTAEEYGYWSKICIQVLSQKSVCVSRQYAKIWEKDTEEADALCVDLMREHEIVQATPEESDDSRMACLILTCLDSFSKVDEPDESCHNKWQEDSNGCRYFSSPGLIRDMSMRSTGKIDERKVNQLLRECGVASRTLRFGDRVFRARIADRKAMAALRTLAGVTEG